MKYNIVIISIILFSTNNIFSNEDKLIRKDLTNLIGGYNYIIESNKEQMKIILFNDFEIDFSKNIKIKPYNTKTVSFIQKVLTNKYKRNIKLAIAPHIPTNIIEKRYRKKQMKLLLLVSLIGVVGLFSGFILFRAIQTEIKNRKKLK